jgi:FkbM family methyltransferase
MPLTLPDPVVGLLRPYWVRGKGRVFDRLVPHDGEREADVFGYRMRLELADLIQRRIYLGSYEPEETATVHRLLRPGMTVIDVGANVGYFTLLASRLVGPTGRVLALEPSPYAGTRLAATLARNAIGQATLQRVALGPAPGTATLFLPNDRWHNHTPSLVASADDSIPVTVPVRRLDACVAEWEPSRPIDLLKMDVEGYEPRVLAGAERTLPRVRAILCEISPEWLIRGGSSPAALVAHLAGHGFHPEARIAEPSERHTVTHLFTRTR